jgi:hypothetical protein
VVLGGAVVRRPAHLGIAATIALLGLAPAADAAPTCTLNWVGQGTTTNWSDANNWNPLRTPTSTDVVCIPAGLTGEPVVDTAVTVSSVQAQSPVRIGTAGVFPAGSLTTTDTANASTFTQLDIAAGSGLYSGGQTQVSGALNAGDSSTPQYATLSGDVTVFGALNAPGFIDFAGSGTTTDVLPGAKWSIGSFGGHAIDSGHTLKTEGNGTVTGNLQGGGAWANAGTVDLNGPAQFFRISNPLTNSGTFTVDPSSGPLTLEGTVTNNGTMSGPATAPATSQTGAKLSFDYLSSLTSTGSISGAAIAAPSTTLGHGASLTNDWLGGQVTIPPGVTVTTHNTGLAATIRGDGVLEETGTMHEEYSCGCSATITDDAALVIAPSATLTLGSGATMVLSGNAILQTDGTTSVVGTGVYLGSYGSHTGATWINDGSVTLDNASINSYNGGAAPNQLFNTGTITENAANPSSSSTNYSTMTSVLNDGTLEVTRGRLLIAALTETSSGVMRVHVGGTTAVTTYGQFAFNPNYTGTTFFWNLAGTFQVVIDPPFKPANGDEYNVISPAGGRYGDFGAYAGLDLGNGDSLIPGWTGSTLTLTANVPNPLSAPAGAAAARPVAAGSSAAASSGPLRAAAGVEISPVVDRAPSPARPTRRSRAAGRHGLTSTAHRGGKARRATRRGRPRRRSTARPARRSRH